MNYRALIILILLFFYFTTTIFANTIPDTIPVPVLFKDLKKVLLKPLMKIEAIKDSIALDTIQEVKGWDIEHKPGIILTQTSFVNWSKGGSNSIAGIVNFKSHYNYKNHLFYWKSAIALDYGLSKQEDIEKSQKTNDIIDLKSSFGYQTYRGSKWFYAGEFSLTTQFTKGFKSNDIEQKNPISTFFAPARMRTGIGANYNEEKNNFSLHISPLTNQMTFVLDQNLANTGSFGVDKAVVDEEGNIIKKGKKSNIELGALIKIDWKKVIMKNVEMTIKSSFYSDYLDEFGNIDTDIDINFDLKVNKFLNASIGSHLLYDDDVQITEDDDSTSGPKVQLKQILGIGVNYAF